MNEPMSSSERVKRHRWANHVEEAADRLLELLKDAPSPLPRAIVIDPELIDMVALFTIDQDSPLDVEHPNVRFLELGNGHQVSNKARALSCAVRVLKNARKIDRRTIELPEFGICHFAAYTHSRGAMISTPNKDDNVYGRGEWHSRDHLVLFRDVGDGTCTIYITRIEPLFALRTIGHHGVTWENIENVSAKKFNISSFDALEAERNGKQV